MIQIALLALALQDPSAPTLVQILDDLNRVVSQLQTVANKPAPPPQATPHYLRMPAGGDLQTVIDAAWCGDTILLPPSVTFRGNFTLRKKPCDGFITIQTDVEQAGPFAPGVRLDPTAAAPLASLQSPNNLATLRTDAGAHHWRVQLVNFGPNVNGYGDIVDIGDGTKAQNDLSTVPYLIVLDRIYMYGDPLQGQKRGIGLNAKDVAITNSTIRDIKTIGQDTQAIGGYNGPGPYVIENNYLEAAGENILFGGDDPYISGLIATGITVRGNYLTKPVSWRDPIVPTPVNLAAVIAGGGMPVGTYTYTVIARRPAGQGNIASSLPATAVPVTLTAAGSVQLTWMPVQDATEYRVYRTSGSGTVFFTVKAPAFTDIGSTGTAGAVPTTASKWLVKNIFELKNASNVLAEHNVFENCWENGQPGYGIVFTVRNSGGKCTWCTVQHVEFRYNIVRHVAAGFNLLGLDDAVRPSVQSDDWNIHDNLVYDVTTSPWGGNGWFAQIGAAPRNVTFDHNTIDHFGSTIISAYGGTATNPLVIPGFKFTNNLVKHNKYGFFGSGLTPGQPSITAYFPDGVITANVLAGGNASKYTVTGNWFPSVDTFLAQFLSPATGDYSLVAGSPYLKAGTDGKDLGADLTQLPK